MKNLELSFCYKKAISIPDKGKLVLNPDGSANILYIYTNEGIAAFDESTGALDLLYGLMEVVGCEYLAINNEICAASKFGEVVLINPQTKEAQEVTFCEGGIKEMSWSPDQEIVTFVTEANMVVVMSCTFDVISEYCLDDQSFGDNEFITVGWGKKETQFHGSEGKQAAKQKVNFIAPQNIDELDKTINISWRGDSELFAVSFVGSAGRSFKVFNKEGKLQYTSEKINDLGTLLAWRPSGSWIAVPQSLPNKYTIALFEKNGLRHRELILPFKQNEEPVVGISWNSDSDILTVETVQGEKSALYLYTICNYHWYLKQFLNFDGKISNLVWDLRVDEGRTLHVLLENGSYLKYKWNFVVHHSFGDSLENQSVVAVIDGNKLLLTDFRNNITPPPMSSYTVKTAHYINFCGFIANPKEPIEYNRMFVVTADDSISLYDLEFDYTPPRRRIQGAKLLYSAKLNEWNLGTLLKNHWFLVNDDMIIFSSNTGKTTTLISAKFNENTLETISETKLNGIVGCITNGNASSILLQLLNGMVYSIKFNSEGEFESSEIFCKLPELCEQAEGILVNGLLKLVSLLPNRNLYLDSTKVASDVTSFYLTKKYILFTLLTTIKFMKLEDNQVIDERSLERGGKLIVVVPSDSRVVIQMPRGNLETISPRVLSLDIVGELLNKRAYAQCMSILRKQRINLNIIVDHNPIDFIENIDVFLQEVSDPNLLNLFLSELQNEQFTQTMYSSNYSTIEQKFPDGYCTMNKIQFICKKMCESMMEKDYNHYLLPIITTYVKVNNLEKALEIIWNEKKSEMETNGMKKTKTTSEDALKYLLYLVDVNELYNEALGMYNFGLVVYVANKSQKDPKEYIPFLNELEQLDENYRKFKIDEHLKRYEKAVEHIARCGAERLPECLEFVQKYALYQKCLSVFQGNEECYKKIALLYGDFLRAQGKHENASIMYERGGNLTQAILSAKHVLDWVRCLQLTSQLKNGDAQEMKNIAQSLVPALQEKGQFEVASMLLKKYVGDFNKSIECLLNSRLYVKAIFETKLESADLLDSAVIPHLKEYAHSLPESIEADKMLFLKYKFRLRTVRFEREQRNTNNIYEDGVDECDLLSDTSSMRSSNFTGSSKGTGKTFRSSKNRRKHERKLLSLKEGNPFEDIALIDALHNLIFKIVDQQLHINQTCKALIEVRCDEEAKRIQTTYKQLLNLIKDSLDEIWIPELMTSQQLSAPNIDYAQLQNEQRYAMINPQKRFKPQLNLFDWEHEILK